MPFHETFPIIHTRKLHAYILRTRQEITGRSLVATKASPGPPAGLPWRNRRYPLLDGVNLSRIAHMPLSVGDKLGPYEIIAPIGVGGMGQVFRALDIRLNRAVAVKTSSEQFSARFEGEARAIAQLNHPHICTLHDVGPNYLVMELVEGETLSARLKNGALPMDQVLRYGAEIADALAAAHAKGITHRDLKPGNIMIARVRTR